MVDPKETRPQLIIQEKQEVKKVSWEDQSLNTSNSSTLNIFSKLKKQEERFNNYDEQPSVTLNDVNDTTINTSITNTNTSITNTNVSTPIVFQELILPKSEIIKQLNEMNKKIDLLYELVYKLTTHKEQIIDNN